jgi:hypothetical protein
MSDEARDKKKKRRKRKKRSRSAEPVKPQVAPLSLARMLALAAALTALGLYVVGTRETSFGGALVLAGLVGMMFCIHRYGRLGPEGGVRRGRA